MRCARRRRRRDAAAGAEAEADGCGAAPVTAEVDAADAADAAAEAAVASSAGTINCAPIFRRLGSRFMNACGFASKSARPARASTPGSCDCVTATAMSLSDWPGRTVIVSGAACSADAALAASGAA